MAIILRPKHVSGLWNLPQMGLLHPEQRNPDIYRLCQATHIARNPGASDPTEILDEKVAYIGGGYWRIICSCGEHTHVDIEWKLSCCFGCGAIYTNIVVPDNWQAIEELLVKRRVQAHRNWAPPETFQDLLDEQIAFGDPT